MYKGRMETVEYIWVNIEKLQECTPCAQGRSTVKECKKMKCCFIYLNRGLDTY